MLDYFKKKEHFEIFFYVLFVNYPLRELISLKLLHRQAVWKYTELNLETNS